MKNIAPHKILSELASTNSRLEKIKILKREAKANNSELFEGIRLATAQDVVFGVKQVPGGDGGAGPYGDGLSFEDFLLLANDLRTRAVTGHDARDLIIVAMRRSTNDQWNGWYRRILIKDLKCGMTENTLNDAMAQDGNESFKVKKFVCMLAHDAGKNPVKFLVGDKIIQPKFDGSRVIATKEGLRDKFILRSRNGKVYNNFPTIEASLNAAFTGMSNMMLDFEVVSESFQLLMKNLRSSEGAAKNNDAKAAIFDVLPLDQFLAGQSKLRYHERRNLLEAYGAGRMKPFANLIVVDEIRVNFNTSEGRAAYQAYKEKALEEGLEGVMLKDPDAYYVCKRSNAWLKVKPFIEGSLRVVGVYEGRKGSEAEGMLGGLTCEGVDDSFLWNGKKVKIEVNVGSGMSLDQRAEWWTFAGQKKVIGMIAEIRADVVSQNEDGRFSLRFPRFKTWRGMKKGEKI